MINLSDVKHIYIGRCNKGYDCKHRCIISLHDGREGSVNLKVGSVSALILSMPKKIECKPKITHFVTNLEEDYVVGKPQRVLNKIFNPNYNADVAPLIRLAKGKDNPFNTRI